MRREADASVAVAEPEPMEPSARPESVPSAAAENNKHAARIPVPEFEAPASAAVAGPAQEAPVSTPVSTMEEPLRSKPAPLRPPLSAGGAAPLHPPLRTGPVPARPVPTPRPGQILSGPRQPLPPAAAPAAADAAGLGHHSSPAGGSKRAVGSQRNSCTHGCPRRLERLCVPSHVRISPDNRPRVPWCPRAPIWWRDYNNSKLVRRLDRFSNRPPGPACRRAALRPFPASPSIAVPFVPASR